MRSSRRTCGWPTHSLDVVAQVWGVLTVGEQELLRLRFYDQRSQTEIAGILGTSQMQVLDCSPACWPSFESRFMPTPDQRSPRESGNCQELMCRSDRG